VKDFIQNFRSILQPSGRTAVSLRLRFAIVLALALTLIPAGILTVIFLTGGFSGESRQIEQALLRERDHFTETIRRQTGYTALRTIQLSRSLSIDMEDYLLSRRVRPAKMGDRPDILAPLQERVLPLLLAALDASDNEGIFLVLNATVNPLLQGSQNSRAGLLIRNSGLGKSFFDENKTILRGVSDAAIKRGISLQSTWELEFNIRGKTFYRKPLDALAPPYPELSSLYVWSFQDPLGTNDKNLLVCSIPVLDSTGSIMGVCGFETDNGNWGEVDRNTLQLPGLQYGFFPGAAGRHLSADRYGIETELRIYPLNSAYAGETFTALVSIPRSIYDAKRFRERLTFSIWLGSFLILGVFLAAVLSGRVTNPISKQMAQFDEETAPQKIQTNVPEIDALIDKILKLQQRPQETLEFSAENGNSTTSPLLPESAADAALPEPAGDSDRIPPMKESYPDTVPSMEAVNSGNPAETLLTEFLARIKTLTPAEKVILKQYAEGYSRQEIMKNLFISEGTLKNHSTNLYRKLDVASRKALNLYVEFLKKTGKYEEIFP